MEQIDLNVLDGVFDRYQAHLDATRSNEIYKWKAVKHFKDTYNTDADDLSAMLADAYQVGGKQKLNLAFGPSWFPIGMLDWFIKVDPQGTLSALENLYDEERDLKTRMVDFETWAKGMLDRVNADQIANGNDPAKNHFQDTRSMSLYLAFMYPESHYLYKTNMYREAAKFLGIGWPGNKFNKVIAYREMCEQILAHLKETRPDLIKESDELLGGLTEYDPNYHMLVQDIVYYITTYDKDFREENGDGEPPAADEWFPSEEEYDPGIDTDRWEELLKNPDVFTEQALEIMLRMRDNGGSATCTQLAQKYGETKNFYNTGSVALAKRVADATECPLPNDEENSRWWPVLYVGKHANKDEVGSYIWKLRDELAEALERVDFSGVKLYVEPSNKGDDPAENAGDTDEAQGHWLLVANAKIWSFFGLEVGAKTSYTIYNEKGNPRRIHKNYLAAKTGDPIIGYESSPTRRIVALCEISKEHDDERLYFHKVRDIEGGLTFDQIKSDPVLSKCEFSKNPNGSFFALTDKEYERFVELLGLEGEEDPEDNPIAPVEDQGVIPSYTDEDFLSDVYVTEDDLADMRALLERKCNLILQGSPGTGKTYCARRLAWAMMGCKDDSRITFVQFHQSTTYDDFVCGYRPDGNGGFVIKDGPFVRACREASNDPDPKRPHFVIIDEINRANVSKVLGELLMLIEADHRGESALLTVSNREFTVPENLYIIGMMNTADRGLALIDYALRRRFAFFDMAPALEHPKFLEQFGENGNPLMEALVKVTKEVNKEIAADAALGEGFRIGHSYFCGAKDARLVLRYELAPLVREYWFDDSKKVRQVLDKLEQAVK